jgi:hypothetical protein
VNQKVLGAEFSYINLMNERLRLFFNFKIEGEIVKKLLIIVLGISAFGLKADMEYMDVIKMELTGNCSVAEIAFIKDDFNKILKDQGQDYQAEIWQPIESDDTTVAYWVGRAPTFPDFAQEFTDYFEQATKGGTPEAGIEESMLNCRTELSRSGFLVQ